MSNEDLTPGNFQDQHAAAAIAAAPPLTLTEELNQDEEEETPGSKLGTLKATLLVNLNLTNREIFSHVSKFKNIPTRKGGSANVYNPLRKANPDSKDPTAGDGIARDAIIKSFDLIRKLHTSSMAFLGDPEQISTNIQSLLDTILKETEAALPMRPNDSVANVVLSSKDEEEEMDLPILLKDVVRITGWVNKEKTSSNTVYTPYTLVVNVTIDAGAFYGKDPHKFVSLAQTFLTNLKKKANTNTVVFLGITVNPAEMLIVDVFEFLRIMVDKTDVYNFAVFGRSELQECDTEDPNWTPPTKLQVDKDLLTNRGDIFLVKPL